MLFSAWHLTVQLITISIICLFFIPFRPLLQEKRRDKIEQKLEQQQTEEKEALANERKFLFLERKAKQAKLEELEQLMELAEEVSSLLLFSIMKVFRC